MRYGIISDIHSNLHALDASLKKIKSLNVDQVLCLGDVVGYNAFPHECISMLKQNSIITSCVKGNHDQIVVDMKENIPYATMGLSQDAYDGVVYSHNNITKEDIDWIKGLPKELVISDSNFSFLITHGFPWQGGEHGFDYILNRYDAKRAFICLEKSYKGVKICLFGHSHIRTLAIQYENDENQIWIKFLVNDEIIDSAEKSKHKKEPLIGLDKKNSKIDNMFLFNAGSIGQPRYNNEVGFGILDTDNWTYEYKTFEYDIEAAYKAIIKAGYSEHIAKRLKK